MVKAWLREDARSDEVGCGPRVVVVLDGDGSGVPVAVREDAPGPSVEVNPVLTVRVRRLVGYDDEGNPVVEWSDVVSTVSTLYEQRQEVDDRSGLSVVRARAVVPYRGDVAVPDTAVIVDDLGVIWRVTSMSQYPDRLEAEMYRLDDGE